MKYKIIFIATIGCIVMTMVFFDNLTFSRNRYHQHEEKSNVVQTDESSKNTYSSHLPIFEIVTEGPIPDAYEIEEIGSKKRNDEMVSASVKYYDNPTGNNIIIDAPSLSEKAKFRVRGRTSRAFDKKGYLIKFKKDDMIQNKKVSISGMVEDSDWSLHGPFLDKTLIRNYLCYNLAGEIMEHSPNVRFCELILNGEFQGLYLLTEKNEYNDEGRIEITETDPEMTSTSYILQMDVGSDDPLRKLTTFNYYTGKNGSLNKRSGLLEITYPGSTLTQTQKYFIENEISQFEKALVSYDSANKNYGFPAFIDIDSFVDYFIINEFTMNSDAGRLSTCFYKDMRGKLKVAVWDFNSAFNNYFDDFSDPQFFMMTDKAWFEYLLRDRIFVKRIVVRYRELRKTFLSDDYLLNYVDETVAFLGSAVQRNNEKWGYSYGEEFDLILPKERNPRSYEESINQLKEMIAKRGAYMDRNIEMLYSLAHDSVNKQFKYQSGENK